tara:strand:+ start:164 stop:952 length:789 start_codon:yes stop_codon:yes gene_type:complete
MPKRDVNKARKAYKKKDIKAMKEAHSKPEIEHHTKEGRYIKSLVYGGLDGIVTTFAIVAGVAGASLTSGIVLILGFANLFADGLSMAVGDYLSSKSEHEYRKAERKRELWEVRYNPKGEKQEMVEIYQEKGMKPVDAKKTVGILSKYKGIWIDTMMHEELNILESKESPVKNGIATFFSFAIFGFVPLLAYVFSGFMRSIGVDVFIIASVLTGGTLFLLGALKVKVTEKNWLKSGLEMLVVGGVAAVVAYLIGYFLSGLVYL